LSAFEKAFNTAKLLQSLLHNPHHQNSG